MASPGLIRIIPPEGDGLKCGTGTKVQLPDGTDIGHGVTKIVVTFAPDEVLTAVLDIAVDPRLPIDAQPLLSLESVAAAADYYGLQLVRKTRGLFAQELLDAIQQYTDANAPEPDPDETLRDPVARHAKRKL